MATTKLFLDQTGLEELVKQIKAADSAVKSYTDEQVAAVVRLIDSVNGDLSALDADVKRDDLVQTINAVYAKVKDAKSVADSALEKATGVETLVGTVPGQVGETQTSTVVAYVDAKVAQASSSASSVSAALEEYKTANDAAVAANTAAIGAEKTRAEGVESGLQTSIDGINTKIGTVEEGKTVVGLISDNLTEAKGYTDSEIAKLGSVLNFKGTVAAVADLPSTGAKAGDVYHVTEKSAEYVYIANGETGNWEELGSVIDLSAYSTTTEVEGKIATAKQEAITSANEHSDGLNTAMDTRVKALEQSIGEGGSVQEKITAAINNLDVTAVGGDGKYIKLVSETDGKISATAGDTSEFATAAQGSKADTALQDGDISVIPTATISGLFA